MFFSRLNRPKTIPVVFGSGENPIFQEQKVDGVMTLVQIGTEPIAPMVNAYRDQCDIYKLIERYSSGDLTALNRRVGQYIDITGLPHSVAEAQQALIDVKANFDKLPDNIRAKFDNDVETYIDKVSHGSLNDFFALMDWKYPQPVVESVKGDSSDESK